MASRPRAPAEALNSGNEAPADGETDDASVRVLRRFRLVFNTVKSHFQHIEKAAGVGGAQVWALSIVAEQPGLGVTGLARAMDVHQSTASNLVRSLVERELVDATRDGPDRRAVQLRVLPAGRRVLRRAPPPLAGVLPQALARLDEATLRRLDHDLAELIAVLDTDHDAAHQPLAHLQESACPYPSKTTR